MRVCKYKDCTNKILPTYNANGRVTNNRQTHCEDHFIGAKIGNPDRAFGNYYVFRRKLQSHAKRNNAEFSLSTSYLRSIFPMFGKCPVIGCELSFDVKSSNGHYPFLERKDPTNGYIEGNVFFVSQLAHNMRHGATENELQNFCKYYMKK